MSDTQDQDGSVHDVAATARRGKVIGIGLNKTGTKTLAHYLIRWGFVHRTYDSNNTYSSSAYDLFAAGDIDGLMEIVDAHDSLEDWPWPLLFREIDARFPEAKFILTVRRSPGAWYRSLCKMAVRIGPPPLFEKHVYGSSMPHGRYAEHAQIYEAHNRAVAEHFDDRPEKLLTICWETGDDANTVAEFLGLDGVNTEPEHVNRNPGWIYGGDSLWRAHVSRILYQWAYRLPRRILRKIGARS